LAWRGKAGRGQARHGNLLKGETMDTIKIYEIKATLRGLAPIMFDKFKDHASPNLPMEQKVYADKEGRLVLPQANIMSFLVGENPGGIVKVDKQKKFREFCQIIKSHVNFTAPAFPFLDGEGNEITSFDFHNNKIWGICNEAGVVKSSGGKIIKAEAKPRPYLELPWSLPIGIILTMTEFNQIVTPELMQDWFIKGGILVGVGTYRPRYGRFGIMDDEWRVSLKKEQ
jgi:hypothetical protein